jgi:colanic acid/amylovoran biosynthesis glycosyltransferase
MLEAFRRAAAHDSELQLDYVGGGPLLWVARQFIEAAGLQSQVHLHGTAPEALKQRLLQECGVFIQHNITDPENGDEEGLPAAIQEAMAYGLAVVSTYHAGIPEAVIDGVTGVLTEEGDVEGMANAISAVCAGGARELGLAGHRRALLHDTWSLEQARLRHWLFEAVD